ncbi:TetR/AcrR family transcriptional regulator [Pseudalkalibacillus sp. R45]|uniref:TetR/AcrR family transcriptional regulator n=1 Tax=Pseudalkalibacillus sp. R45 TaxID=3457433 RepID=UPI003FCDE9F8
MNSKNQELTTRQQRSIQTRKNLLEAAQLIFIEQGFQKTTITQIIKKADTGYGTAYVHFKNKDDILIELIDDVMQKFHEIAELPFQPSSVEDAKQLIEKQTHLFLEMAQKEDQILKVVEEAIGSSPAVQSKWKEIRERFIKGIRKDISYTQQQGLARKDVDPHLVARGWFFSNEMYLWEIVRGENQASVKDIVYNLSTMYVRGLYKENLAKPSFSEG